jgi:Na+/proline symporter
MSPSVLITLIFGAVFLPVLVFTSTALLGRSTRDPSDPPDTAEDFLLAGRQISPGDFINSSTGYMLQVSTTFYFIFWGYNYGFSNIFYMLSWAAGIFVLGLFAGQLVRLRVEYTTLPALLSESKSGPLQVLASLVTMLSFAGVFYVEAFFTTDLVMAGAGAQLAQSGGQIGQAWWAVFSIITLVTAAYSMLGGLRKVVANDVWQLSFAYLGLSIVFCLLLSATYRTNPSDGLLMSFLCTVMLLSIMLCDRRLFDGRIKFASLALSLVLVLSVSAANFPDLSDLQFRTALAGPFQQILQPWGWFTLLGFTLTNLVWQFSDSSVFQRISALRLSGDKPAAERELRRAVSSLAVVSPLTWSLGIVLGMLIKTSGIVSAEPGAEYVALIEYFRTQIDAGQYLFLVGLLALNAA